MVQNIDRRLKCNNYLFCILSFISFGKSRWVEPCRNHIVSTKLLWVSVAFVLYTSRLSCYQACQDFGCPARNMLVRWLCLVPDRQLRQSLDWMVAVAPVYKFRSHVRVVWLAGAYISNIHASHCLRLHSIKLYYPVSLSALLGRMSRAFCISGSLLRVIRLAVTRITCVT